MTLSKPELLDDWPKSRENVFVRNKEEKTNTKQHLPKSRRVRNKMENMTKK